MPEAAEEEMKRLSKLPENKLCASCDAENRCVSCAPCLALAAGALAERAYYLDP